MGYFRMGANGRPEHVKNGQVGANVEVDAVNNTGAQIDANSFVDLFNNAGTLEMRLASAGATERLAQGYVLANTANTNTGRVRKKGLGTGFAGMTPGVAQYLSPTTPGARTEVVPTAVNQSVQFLGTANSATELTLDPDIANAARIV